MEPNLVQLNSLSKIVAEELRKMCNGFIRELDFIMRVELRDDTGSRSYLTPPGGEVWEVTFNKNLYGGINILRWYLINPSKSSKCVVVYPHRSQAEIISQIKSVDDYERFARQIAEFKEDNEKVQQYLESISSGTEYGCNAKDLSWVIDPTKIFQ